MKYKRDVCVCMCVVLQPNHGLCAIALCFCIYVAIYSVCVHCILEQISQKALCFLVCVSVCFCVLSDLAESPVLLWCVCKLCGLVCFLTPVSERSLKTFIFFMAAKREP